MLRRAFRVLKEWWSDACCVSRRVLRCLGGLGVPGTGAADDVGRAVARKVAEACEAARSPAEEGTRGGRLKRRCTGLESGKQG